MTKTFVAAVQKSELKRIAERNMKERIKEKVLYEKESQLLQEQIAALRASLKASQSECDLVKKDLEKEVPKKTNLFHNANFNFNS